MKLVKKKVPEQGGTDDSKGYFVEPTIISGLKSKDRIMQEEIFGPVVGFVKVNDFDEAIEVANDTDYGLTGAVDYKIIASIGLKR